MPASPASLPRCGVPESMMCEGAGTAAAAAARMACIRRRPSLMRLSWSARVKLKRAEPVERSVSALMSALRRGRPV